jgi:hypothetical protein
MNTAADRTPIRLSVDHAEKRAEVELASGLVLASSLSGEAAEHEGEIDRTDYDPESAELTITFRWGDTATFELGPADAPSMPIVYLDQNHWVMLARLQWAPHKLTAHREGYERLMGLACERAIILPLSSAHAFETGRKDGRQRRELATTMLQLSRGWQMRNPLKVRREELVCAIAGLRTNAPLRPRPVFTLDPDALFDGSDYQEESSPERDLHARLTWASAIAETLIEDEREDGEIARAKTERWANLYAARGIELGEVNASREKKRAAAHAAILEDFTNDLAGATAAAGLDLQAWEDWLENSEESIAAMPAMGRIQEITVQRLSNPQYPWRVNDLSDMHFLSCAAGYADFVLAESATTHDLRLAESRVPAGAQVCRSPEELVEVVASP